MNRFQIRAVVGLLTGHCALKGHLHRMGLYNGELKCRICNRETETAHHILRDCETLDRKRQAIYGHPKLCPEDYGTQPAGELHKLVHGTRLLEWVVYAAQNTQQKERIDYGLNGTVNKQNCRYWSTENTHWMMESNTQYPEKVNVWAGIINSQMIGPYFFDSSLTGARYLDFLQNLIRQEINEITPETIQNVLEEFQQRLHYCQEATGAQFEHLI
ncbi:hypothetical protein NQ318_019262 [Aromia moschata]|uniref:Reverse transcriptase zinc-binding domain-containing protein n=1 Tax=Aromia moschata TaxID=1265417 RepID=A0AAV8YXH4_9CUCU|nr:hypothetical protein NQ318_019262 [Aromia moschata]